MLAARHELHSGQRMWRRQQRRDPVTVRNRARREQPIDVAECADRQIGREGTVIHLANGADGFVVPSEGGSADEPQQREAGSRQMASTRAGAAQGIA